MTRSEWFIDQAKGKRERGLYGWYEPLGEFLYLYDSTGDRNRSSYYSLQQRVYVSLLDMSVAYITETDNVANYFSYSSREAFLAEHGKKRIGRNFAMTSLERRVADRRKSKGGEDE